MHFKSIKPILMMIMYHLRLGGVKVVFTLTRNFFIIYSCCAASGIMLLSSYFGISIWKCPFYALFGLPCPGCGMTRGVIAFFAFDFSKMLSYNPLSPYIIFWALLSFISIFLREKKRKFFSRIIIRFEKKVPLNAFFLVLIVIYGVVRLLFMLFLGRE